MPPTITNDLSHDPSRHAPNAGLSGAARSRPPPPLARHLPSKQPATQAGERLGKRLRPPVWVRALGATLLVQTVSSLAAAAVPLLGPVLTLRWGWAPESIGYVSAATSVGICWYLASGNPMLLRYGAVRSLQIGLVVVAAGLLLLAQPVWIAGLFGALLLGLGLGPNTPGGSQILIRTAPKDHRSLIFSIKQAGVPLGGALAGLSVAVLVERLGFSGAVQALAVLCVLCAILVQPSRPALDEDRDRRRRDWPMTFLSPSRVLRSLGVLSSHGSLPMLTVIGVAFSILQACVTAFTATYLVTRHGESLAGAGQFVALLLTGSAIARICFGWVADRVDGLMLLAVLAFAASAAVILLITVADTAPWALLACMALLGATSLGWNGVHMAELARRAPPLLVGEVTSASSLFGFVGSVLGPIAFAVVAKQSGSFELAFALAAGQLAIFGVVTAIYCVASARGRAGD